jgi:hypothetical protein
MVPTVLRIGGVRVVVYFNDHPPAHVHVLGRGWVVVVNLFGPSVREVINYGEREAREALQLVVEHRIKLLEAWRQIHG